jgi:hypothetical protein
VRVRMCVAADMSSVCVRVDVRAASRAATRTGR